MQPPKRLKGDARKKWVETFTDFNPDSALDTELACQYCENWALYIRAVEEVAKGELTHRVGSNAATQPHPGVGIMKQVQQLNLRIYVALKGKMHSNDDEGELI